MTIQEREVFVFPMAFAQQRLWFLEQLQPGSPLYHLSSLLHVRGGIDPAVLGHCVNALIERHEILRTTFAMADGQPVQLVAPSGVISVGTHDVTAVDPAYRSAVAQEQAKARCQLPFDLTTGPLLRVDVFHLGASEDLLCITLHHIIADGWSLGVFINELTSLYAARQDGRPGQLPPLPIQYADYAGWQHDWLRGDQLRPQLDYWRDQLVGAPTVLELPTDNPRPPTQTFNGRTFSFAIPPELGERLRRLCQETQTTPFMPLLGVWASVLSRYSGQADLVIGTPIANRNRAETAPLIGFFVNTLAMRIRLDDQPTLLMLLDRIRRTSLDAHEHQDIPFEQLVSALNLERNLGHSPLFQVMFAHQHVANHQITVSGLDITPLPLDLGTAKFDLTLFIEEDASVITGRLEYNSDLFASATVERLSSHFLALLDQALACPTQPLDSLSLLTPVERQTLLVGWNQTTAEYPSAASLPLLVEQQAARTPEAVAVLHGTERVTYAELDGRANQLAQHLRRLGVGPNVLVGIAARRHPTMIIGLLGILKAGGAYVPLDIQYPAERLRFMARDAGLAILLVNGAPVAEWADVEHIVDLDTDWPLIAEHSANQPEGGAGPEDLAYVIYTSGSTGQPKGVLIPHRGVVNYLHWAIQAYPLDQGCGAPLASSLSFDATITALWAPLITGRTVELVPEEHEIEELAAALTARKGYSLLKVTPAHLEALSQLLPAQPAHGQAGAFIIGGEALLAQHLDFWRRYAPDIRLINEYGPTETVVGCAIYEVGADSMVRAAVPIGRPIANTQLYVLDSSGQPAPIGVPGELYIGGLGVGLGYHRRPELTAARFVRLDQLPGLQAELDRCDGAAPSQLLYRSGDLVRYLADGNLEYLGRIDQQIKLHGFRIEPGEIESVLSRHPAVQAAAVIVREDRPGHKRLVGYIVPTSREADLNQGELADFVRQHLPAYMAPAVFVALDELPLTPNGKLDRRALPEPAAATPATSPAEVPQEAVERTLAAIWGEVLGLPEIGRHANFFSSGGDSILVMQVISRARSAGLHFSPRQLFQHQTIAALARNLQQAPEAPPPDPASLHGSVPLTPIQRWFVEQRLELPHHFNQSVLLHVSRTLDPQALQAALDRLIQIHPALRLRWAPDGPGWTQRYHPAEPVPLITCDLDHATGESWETHLGAIDARLQSGLHLTDGPLIQAALIRNPSDARLLIVAHHAIIDAVSWRVLLEDLALLLAGEEPLPESVPFSVWAEHLAARAAAPATLADFTYWSTAISTIPDLPRDQAAAPERNTVDSARSLRTMLARTTTETLLHALPETTRASVAEILLTALALAWRQWSGAPTLVLDLESHGRLADGHDLSRSLGWFTSLYPTRIDLPDQADVQAALRAVKEQSRAVPDSGVGYGLLRYLHPDSAVRQSLVPLQPIPVLFNYLGQLDSALNVGPFEGLAADIVGRTRAGANRRSHWLEINAYVEAGQLIVDWEYSVNAHTPATIERLAGAFVASVEALLAHDEPDSAALAPSDFPAARVSAKDLDSLLARLKRKGS